MAGSLNKVMLIGNLGKDPEVRTFEGGGKIVNFSLATSENYTNKAGDKVSHTEWHNISVSRTGLAGICEQYLKKGHKIYAEGRLRTRSWQDQNGVTKYTTEIKLDNMTMLTSREDAQRISQGQTHESSSSSSPSATSAQATNETSAPNLSENDKEVDDLPF